MSTGAVTLVAALLFAVGLAGVLVRRNPLVMFMAAEMMWNAAALVLVAASRHWGREGGQAAAFLVIAAAAAEVGIGLALIVATYQHRHRLDADVLKRLRG
ncbi:NADH:ubiquinone oxidoreductase subunit K [Candidatus Hydrogenisulfobacillus filiaventi]|uniref:NADH-quinone oxidoreductase subunit K n=1 Tax=Candidatus Hydrogenisulfobacillus filiaventi TaxID=2707344 RepID=A0A6F8ZHY8_9FIRM|nr:NADH:ubiquinone oxidoreductase subunit K [Candidatus Hydrogenisulfobacillus filiaventi]